MAADFVHLHVHGQHSLLDGLIKADDAVAAAVEDGQAGFALTDHGRLSGTMKAAVAANQAGIAFWPGQEIYLSLGSRHDHNVTFVPREDDFDGTGGDDGTDGMKRKIYEHLTVIAGTGRGWKNLMELSDKMHDSFWAKPRADYALLGEYADGLTIGTGCLGGPVAGQLLIGDADQAEKNLRTLIDIAGTDNLFVEVMDHGIPAERKVVGGLVELAAKYDLPVVATNDSHYARASQAEFHDAWLCVAQSHGANAVRMGDPGRFKFSGTGYHLRTAAEMHELFDGQPGTEQAVANSMKVVEGFDKNPVLETVAGYHRMPTFPIPDGLTAKDYLYRRVKAGLIERYGSLIPAEAKTRARRELDVMHDFGVETYMLVKADVLAEERSAGGLVGAGRGSAPGSIVAYALGITQLDPLRHGLLFERFLNPTRKGLPDIDSDFQASRRDTVVLRAAETYGADKVARVGTYGQSWAKAALKQMGRVYGLESLANKMADAVPKSGNPKEFTVANLMDPKLGEGAELRRLVESNPDAARLAEAAMAVEGSAANETVHACGVVISDEPIDRVAPLRRTTHKEGELAFPVTEWDAGDVEKAELIKFDFLAIKDLDVCADAIGLIEQTTGEKVDFYALDADADDERSRRAKDMLAAGRTAGVFQISGGGITELTRDIRPDCATDLAAILALYRPGPMGANQHTQYANRRRGGEPVDYSVFTRVPAEQDVIASVLDQTLGSISFQEQLMQLARDIADFAPGQMADLQKAFSKKKQEMMDALEEVWYEGGQSNVRADQTPKVAFRHDTLATLWAAFKASGKYLFNACLTGDTVLTNGHGTDADAWTVERLYTRLHGNDDAPEGLCPFCCERPRAPRRADGMCRRCRSWTAKFTDRRGFTLMAYSPTWRRLMPQRVKDVHFNGVRPVFTVALSDGRTVRATDNHRFLSPNGWVHVRDMEPGDMLVVSAADGSSFADTVAQAAIVSIAAAGSEPVYDVEMAEGTDHNFVANGVVSHNSHAYAYASLTWQTAYLKANWPAQYGAALLKNTDKDEKRRALLVDLVAEGLQVRPPSVVNGQAATSVSPDGAIVLGLAEVKGVGKDGETIIAERDAHGPFTSLSDLVDRTKLSSSKIQALAESGALDDFGTRMGIAMASRALRVPGLPVPDCEWGVVERAARQRERLGLVVGEHPMVAMREQIVEWKHKQLPDLLDFRNREIGTLRRPHTVPNEPGQRVDMVGVVASVEEGITSRGRRVKLVLESAKGQCEVMAWPEAYSRYRSKGYPTPRPGQLLFVHGQIKVHVPVTEVAAEVSDEGAAEGDQAAEVETVELEPIISVSAHDIVPVDMVDDNSPLGPPPGFRDMLGTAPQPEPPMPRARKSSPAGKRPSARKAGTAEPALPSVPQAATPEPAPGPEPEAPPLPAEGHHVVEIQVNTAIDDRGDIVIRPSFRQVAGQFAVAAGRMNEVMSKAADQWVKSAVDGDVREFVVTPELTYRLRATAGADVPSSTPYDALLASQRARFQKTPGRRGAA